MLPDSALPPSRFGAGYTAGRTMPTSPTSSTSGFPQDRTTGTAPELDRPPPVNKLAVSTFVATVVMGLLVAPFTFPLSYLAYRQTRSSGQPGAALARASMIISGVYLVLGIVVITLYLFPPGVGDIR